MNNTLKRILIVIGILLIIICVWKVVESTIVKNQNILTDIEKIEYENKNIKDIKLIEDNIEEMLWGEEEYFDILQDDKVGVSSIIAGTSVQIIPNPDFLDTQVFHYDMQGNLVMYVLISNTVGGQIKYYFNNGEIVKISNEMEENINVELINKDDILKRANLVYDRYFK